MLGDDKTVVVNCVHGHNVSQLVAARLRSFGIPARVLSGGIEEWIARGFPTVLKGAAPEHATDTPSRWIAQLKLGVDDIATAWLIQRFVDPDSAFHFTSKDQLRAIADELGATPLVPEDALSQSGFAQALATSGLSFEPLDRMAMDIEKAASGNTCLTACLRGAAQLANGDPYATLANGFHSLDALYAWYARPETGAGEAGDSAA